MILPNKDVLVLCVCISFVILTLGAVGNKGRYHAQMILCQTNLKGYGNAYIMYIDDNDQNFPNAHTWLYLNPNTPSPQCLWHDRSQNLENNPDNEAP